MEVGLELPIGFTYDKLLFVVLLSAGILYVVPATKLSWSDHRVIAPSSVLEEPTIVKLYMPDPKLDFAAITVVFMFLDVPLKFPLK